MLKGSGSVVCKAGGERRQRQERKDENEGARGWRGRKKAGGKREDGQSRKEALRRERERQRIVKVIN